MSISKQLKKLNLVTGKKTLEVFEKSFPKILTETYVSEAAFVRKFWKKYKKTFPKASNALNGHVFEALLAIILYRSGIKPIYVQANLEFVPNVDFDFVGYSKECGPVVLSAKTSLRERYKQADLEGRFMKQVHQKARCYLITLEASEARTVNAKVDEGQTLGIDRAVVMNGPKFDDLIKELKAMTFIIPEKVQILTGKRMIK